MLHSKAMCKWLELGFSPLISAAAHVDAVLHNSCEFLMIDPC